MKTKPTQKKHAKQTPQKAAPVTAAARHPSTLAVQHAENEGMIVAPGADHHEHPVTTPAAVAAGDVQGEGNYEAGRRYDEGVARSVAKGDTEKLAEKAADALSGPEADELRKAEAAAKRGPHAVSSR